MSNFVKIGREVMQLWWYKDVSLRLVMMHLIMTANHADVQMPGILVKRGSTVTSRSKMRAEIGITDKVLRRCLRQLEMAGEVTKNPINKTSKMGTVITICKYDTYTCSEVSFKEAHHNQEVQEGSKIGPTKRPSRRISKNTDNQQYTDMKNNQEVQEGSKIGPTNKNIYGRNILSKDKNITPLVAGAPTREEAQVQISKKEEIELLRKKFFSQEQAGAFEQLCMSMHCTPTEFKEIAEEIFAEWLLTEEPVKENYSSVSRHLIATSRIKLAERRRAAAREPKKVRTKEQWESEVAAYFKQMNQTFFS